MELIVKTQPEELKRAQKWWADLEIQWKMAYNEAVFDKGPTLESPKDDELMTLLIRANTLRFAGPLSARPNLSVELTNLSGLIPLYHLHFLSITHTKISSLMELEKHTNLKHLFLYDNQITSLKGIEGIKGLKELYVQNNLLESLKPVKKLTKLETLYCSGNQLIKINGLTEKHSDNMKRFVIMPNEHLRDRDIIKFQNKIGIICKKG